MRALEKSANEAEVALQKQEQQQQQQKPKDAELRRIIETFQVSAVRSDRGLFQPVAGTAAHGHQGDAEGQRRRSLQDSEPRGWQR